MDKALSILLVEDEPAECEQFLEYIGTQEDVRLAGVTDSAGRALEIVEDCSPDAVILDLELHKGSGSGISFLSGLRKIYTPFFPYILVTTNNISKITHEHVRHLGADFVMVKSQEDYSVHSVIEFLRALKGIIFETRRKSALTRPDTITPNVSRKRLIALVSADIDRVGISPKVVGRRYIIDAVLMVGENQTQNFITAVAQKYGKTESSVERAMQNAINRAWRTADIEELQNCYTARISSDKGVPTLTEFVYFYANKVKLNIDVGGKY